MNSIKAIIAIMDFIKAIITIINIIMKNFIKAIIVNFVINLDLNINRLFQN